MHLTLNQTKKKVQTEKVADNFKFDENGRKSSTWVENAVGKGDIALYEQFLFFSTVFSKGLYCIHVKTMAYFGNGLN